MKNLKDDPYSIIVKQRQNWINIVNVLNLLCDDHVLYFRICYVYVYDFEG